MNNRQLTKLPVIPERYYSKEAEDLIEQKDHVLKQKAVKDALHLAERNVPPLKGSSIMFYIGEIKAGYEEMISAVYHLLEAGTHMTKGKTEYDLSRKGERELTADITLKEELNHNAKRDMEGYNPKLIRDRKYRSYLIIGAFALVETILNMNAFQIMGDSKLFAFLLSLGLSILVCVLAHMTALVFKECKTRLQRILTVAISLSIAIAIFLASAKLRSDYFKVLNVEISSSAFVIYNLAFFIVSGVLAFFLYPSWKEIQEDRRRAKAYSEVLIREAEINRLKKELKSLENETLIRGQFRIGMPVYTQNLVNRIKKKYRECVEKFINTNIMYRPDRQVPNCFSDDIPDLDAGNLGEDEFPKTKNN